jgi:hypothetical protein
MNGRGNALRDTSATLPDQSGRHFFWGAELNLTSGRFTKGAAYMQSAATATAHRLAVTGKK